MRGVQINRVEVGVWDVMTVGVCVYVCVCV